jgi:hypothetical protein
LTHLDSHAQNTPAIHLLGDDKPPKKGIQ